MHRHAQQIRAKLLTVIFPLLMKERSK